MFPLSWGMFGHMIFFFSNFLGKFLNGKQKREVALKITIVPCIVLKNSGLAMWFGWLANIYGSSVGWLENTRTSMQSICYLYWKESNSVFFFHKDGITIRFRILLLHQMPAGVQLILSIEKFKSRLGCLLWKGRENLNFKITWIKIELRRNRNGKNNIHSMS